VNRELAEALKHREQADVHDSLPDTSALFTIHCL